MNTTLPKYIGVLAEPNKNPTFFASSDLSDLMRGEFRSEINRVESLKPSDDPLFPVFVSVLGTKTEPYRFFTGGTTRAARTASSLAWAEAVQKYEAAGGNREDSQSPLHDTFSWNSELGHGRFWRIYTEYLGRE